MSCTVELDNLQRQYYPGSEVKGIVTCVFEDTRHVREIRVKLKGKEHNSWTTPRHAGKKNQHPRHYKAENKFLALKTIVREGGIITPGQHKYHFTFTLPKDIPGSYYSGYGCIKFTVKATVERTLGHNYKDEKEFIVISLIDLNTMTDDLNFGPTAYSEDKMLNCCCCSKGPIMMVVTLEREVYVPGESIPVKVDITNMSDDNIERLDVKLTKITESTVTTPKTERKYEYELLASANDTGVGAHGQRIYNFLIEIPTSTAIHNFNLCTLFKQWTTLMVKAVLPGMHMSMKISAKILLGHVPIGGQLQNVLRQGRFVFVPHENSNLTTAAEIQADPNRPTYSLANNTAVFQIAYPIPSDPSISGVVDSTVPQPVVPSQLPGVHKSTVAPNPEIAEGEHSNTNAPGRSAPPTYDEAVAAPPLPPKMADRN